MRILGQGRERQSQDLKSTALVKLKIQQTDSKTASHCSIDAIDDMNRLHLEGLVHSIIDLSYEAVARREQVGWQTTSRTDPLCSDSVRTGFSEHTE